MSGAILGPSSAGWDAWWSVMPRYENWTALCSSVVPLISKLSWNILHCMWPGGCVPLNFRPTIVGTTVTADYISQVSYCHCRPYREETGWSPVFTRRGGLQWKVAARYTANQALSLLSACPLVPPRPAQQCSIQTVWGTSDLDFALCAPDLTS